MYYKYKDFTLYYEKHGNKKKSLLILPGWGNTRKTFNNIINYLSNYYTIYILDYPGFGNSPIINNKTIYDYADAIYNFSINKHLDTIIAHSFGGRISSILIGKYNLKIKHLVLIDVAGINYFNLKLYLKTKIYKLLNKITKYKYVNKLNKYFSSPDYNETPMKETFKNIVNEDLREYYRKIKTDTLIIWGEKDKITPLKSAKHLNKIIKNSSLIIYKEKGHFPYLEEPFLTNKILYYLLISSTKK